jgi:hypothetical protein
MGKAIGEKLLEGLVYRSAEKKEQAGKDGKKKINVPIERPLEPSDVLDWKDYGDYVVIVAADGQKHRVEKPKK